MSNNFHKKDFDSILYKKGVTLNTIQKKQFKDYAEMLVDWNQKMNLTAIKQIDEIYEKHFLDSVLPSFNINIQGTFCDVGAGAGFPSIPLKIIYPTLNITIVETLGKRITFLKALCVKLGLHDVECIHARAEEYAKEHRETFDFVSARAVANLSLLSELCIPLVKQGGYFLALKGAQGDEEYKRGKQAVETLGCTLKQRDEMALSDGSKRINFVFLKDRITPTTYPRAFAQMKKHPL